MTKVSQFPETQTHTHITDSLLRLNNNCKEPCVGKICTHGQRKRQDAAKAISNKCKEQLEIGIGRQRLPNLVVKLCAQMIETSARWRCGVLSRSHEAHFLDTDVASVHGRWHHTPKASTHTRTHTTSNTCFLHVTGAAGDVSASKGKTVRTKACLQATGVNLQHQVGRQRGT